MKIFITLFITIICSIGASAQENTNRQIEGKMEKEVTRNFYIKYLLYLPVDYDQREKWPLVLFLHGSGERGNDLNIVKRNGPPMLVQEGRKFPFILISPQCPMDKLWDPLLLTVLLDEIENKFKVDKNRIYITGLSIGGEGTWELAMATPKRFAAIAPVCGRTGSLYLNACIIKDLPIWVFHGAKDDIVSISESERMIKALKDCGSNVRFTVYPEGNHNAWTDTYNNDELYTWLLEHHLVETAK
ncbi:MAG TPA: prolyl oligopeptidase family serine peptidase [Ignavibacteriaceae bacterium]|nr:prolyl oligopeptidase family serine peptidase [Ignavibacteriaceae bacterium]